MSARTFRGPRRADPTKSHRRTVADMNARAHQRKWQYVYREPAEIGEYLFVTPQGCLTHIIRWRWDRPATNRGVIDLSAPRHHGYEALCGVGTGRQVTIVDPADELFGCHRCIALAERYALPTFDLLPSTGCQATEGARYRPRSTA